MKCPVQSISLTPALAEDVMFSTSSLCVSSWLLATESLDLGTMIIISRKSLKVKAVRRSKVKVTKVKKIQFLIFSILSENEVKGQCHEVKVQGHDVKVTRLNSFLGRD